MKPLRKTRSRHSAIEQCINWSEHWTPYRPESFQKIWELRNEREQVFFNVCYRYFILRQHISCLASSSVRLLYVKLYIFTMQFQCDKSYDIFVFRNRLKQSGLNLLISCLIYFGESALNEKESRLSLVWFLETRFELAQRCSNLKQCATVARTLFEMRHFMPMFSYG